jgi:hypothetical protein
MKSEIDIVSIVHRNRISYFLHKERLDKYQRYFVNKFKFYNLSLDEQENAQQVDRRIAESVLIEN